MPPTAIQKKKIMILPWRLCRFGQDDDLRISWPYLCMTKDHELLEEEGFLSPDRAIG